MSVKSEGPEGGRLMFVIQKKKQLRTNDASKRVPALASYEQTAGSLTEV